MVAVSLWCTAEPINQEQQDANKSDVKSWPILYSSIARPSMGCIALEDALKCIALEDTLKRDKVEVASKRDKVEEGCLETRPCEGRFET